MRKTKFLLTVAGNLLFAVAVIVIAVAISQNTNWFQRTVYLTCWAIESDGFQESTDPTFTLAISKLDNTAWWHGMAHLSTGVVDYPKHNVRVTWTWNSDDQTEDTFVMSRTTGVFRFQSGERHMAGTCWSAPGF